MRLALCLLLLAASPAAADWVPRADVAAVLDGVTLDYEGAHQSFAAGGTTSYVTDRPSAGRWAERDGRYCSQWPPSGRWDCYDLATSEDGTRMRFTDDAGNPTVGRVRP